MPHSERLCYVPAVTRWFNDGGDGDAPEWASFFDGEAYRAFVDAVRADLEGRGIEFRIDDGIVHIPRESGGNRMGLKNLAQRCHAAAKPSEWAAIIAGHFDTTLGGFSEMEALDTRLENFEAMKDHLKLRVYPRSMLDNLPEAKLVWWSVTDDLIAVLTVDLPTSVVTVSEEVRGHWTVDDDALFELARDNVARFDPPTVEDLDAGEGIALRALFGDSFFIASHLMHLAHFVDPPPHGLLFSVPHRHTLLLHRIVDAKVVLAINAMLGMTQQMHIEGPGSLSNQLYWWHEGQLMRLPSEVDGQTLRFIPPPAFIQKVLEPLAGG